MVFPDHTHFLFLVQDQVVQNVQLDLDPYCINMMMIIQKELFGKSDL